MVVIQVDTSKDSKEELQRVIRFLQEHVGNASALDDATSQDRMPESNNSFMNMFGSADISERDSETDSSEANEKGSEDDTVIEIVEYD